MTAFCALMIKQKKIKQKSVWQSLKKRLQWKCKDYKVTLGLYLTTCLMPVILDADIKCKKRKREGSMLKLGAVIPKE